jgi:hypothetical protein
MMEAEQEIIALGDGAIPRLVGLFDGSSKNEWATPYRALGLPLRCALEMVVRLGPVAKPLEAFVAAELPASETAARALGALGELAPSSIDALAQALGGDMFVASEAAVALVRCKEDNAPVVVRAIKRSDAARKHLETARQMLANRM